MSEIILNGLAQLNVENDEHWTTEGLPRLDILKDLTGTQITRDMLNSAAKGFTRSNPTLPTAVVPFVNNSEQPSNVLENINTEFTQFQTEVTNLSPLEQKIKHLQEEQSKANVALSEARKHLDEVNKHLDAVLRQQERTGVSDRNVIAVSAVQAYQESQRKQRENRLG